LNAFDLLIQFEIHEQTNQTFNKEGISELMPLPMNLQIKDQESLDYPGKHAQNPPFKNTQNDPHEQNDQSKEFLVTRPPYHLDAAPKNKTRVEGGNMEMLPNSSWNQISPLTKRFCGNIGWLMAVWRLSSCLGRCGFLVFQA
jgi:hypothetical protein